MSWAAPRGTCTLIAQVLRHRIADGEIGEVLPSEAELMRAYGVSRSTITRALNILKAEGVIESVQGAGWYVAGTGDRRPVVERLVDMLGGAAPGDALPTEKELCQRLGVSRGTVRSAVAQLEGRGLIEKDPNRRRRVR